MKLAIKARNLTLSPSESERIKRRVHYCFFRIKHHIRDISLTLEDINGPKGGRDKECRINVSLNSGKTLFLSEKQAELGHAADKVLQRASFNVQKRLKRTSKHKHFAYEGTEKENATYLYANR